MSGNVIKLLTLSLFLLTLPSLAEDWKVMPQICIAKNTGEACEMTITVSEPVPPLSSHTQDTFCAFIDDRQQVCWSTTPPPPQTIKLQGDSWIFIKNANGDIVFSQKLLVKWERNEKRRRVRDPWSLF